jgi:hypothetical protein
LPDQLKQVYGLLAQAQAETQQANGNLNRIAAEEGKNPRDTSYRERHVTLCRLSALAQILDVIFIAEMKMAFPEGLTKPFVLVRVGWKVVWRDRPEGSASPVSQSETLAPERLN